MKKVLLLSLVASSLHSAEIDHFTHRNQHISDSTKVLNQKLNVYLNEALEMANYLPKTEVTSSQYRDLKNNKTVRFQGTAVMSCTHKDAEEILYKKMRVYFSSHLNDNDFFNFYFKDDAVDRKTTDLKKSIYGEWEFFNGQLLASKKAAESGIGIAPIFKYDQIEMGTDKFEHFFSRGLSNFTRFYLKGMDFKTMMKKDMLMERTILGGNFLATGVFSYADLSANFNGLRFWNSVLQKREDFLGENNIGPFVRCNDKNGKWEKVKDLDLRPFVDESWDEAVNCIMLSTKEAAEKVNVALERLNMTCPLVPNTFDRMVKKYGEIGAFLLNKHGIQKKAFKAYFNDYGILDYAQEEKSISIGKTNSKLVVQKERLNFKLDKKSGKILRIENK
jgi:hypothetical protein